MVISLKYYMFMLVMNIMLILLIIMLMMMTNNTLLVFESSMRSMSEMQFNYTFMLDSTSLIFMTTVSFISTVVMYYSKDYMKSCNMSNKFFITMLMFISSMLVLSSSANLLWLMVGWDGLGLTSFFLIMYFQNWKSLNSAMVTFISNRIGDLFMIVSIVIMFNVYSLSCMNSMAPLYENNYYIVMSIFIMIAGFSKSAQVPFSAWLPLAMAAPTPVSALVHSSTLVTAGVFLTIRFFPVIYNDLLMNLMLLVSSLTMILASLSALWEFDLKKIIALSTLSHIGFMMMFISIGDIKSATIHMVMHAMFKSLLFMCAGLIIHDSNNFQDIRRIFSSPEMNYKLSSCLSISIFSMMGIPFMSGFYSKDLMVLTSMNSYNNLFIYSTIMFSAFLTCCYSMRLYKFIYSEHCTNFKFMMEEKTNNGEMEKAVMIMTVASTVLGGLAMSLLVNMESTIYSISDSTTKLILFTLMLMGMFIGFNMSNIKIDKYFINVMEMCNKMWFVGFIIMPMQWFYLNSSSKIFNNNDIKGWLDYLMVIMLNNELKVMMMSLNNNMFKLNPMIMIMVKSMTIPMILMILLI